MSNDDTLQSSPLHCTPLGPMQRLRMRRWLWWQCHDRQTLVVLVKGAPHRQNLFPKHTQILIHSKLHPVDDLSISRPPWLFIYLRRLSASHAISLNKQSTMFIVLTRALKAFCITATIGPRGGGDEPSHRLAMSMSCSFSQGWNDATNNLAADLHWNLQPLMHIQARLMLVSRKENAFVRIMEAKAPRCMLLYCLYAPKEIKLCYQS